MPDHPTKSPGSSGLPATRLSAAELEVVIRRATELQFAGGDTDDGLPETEVMRIGKELGLEPAHVRRAIAEVRGGKREERGLMTSVMGASTVRVARTVDRPATEVAPAILEYLTQTEYMAVQRSFVGGRRFVRGSGVGAAFGRARTKIQSRDAMLDLAELDVQVTAIDDASCVVELAVDTGGMRAGLMAAGVTTGGGAAASIATVAMLSAQVADPLALLGVPIVGGAVMLGRLIYRSTNNTLHDRLESFLDRVERRDLRVPRPPDWRKHLGF